MSTRFLTGDKTGKEKAAGESPLLFGLAATIINFVVICE
jgi:hypothetical protein